MEQQPIHPETITNDEIELLCKYAAIGRDYEAATELARLTNNLPMARFSLEKRKAANPRDIWPSDYLVLAAMGDQTALSEAHELASSDLVKNRYFRQQDPYQGIPNQIRRERQLTATALAQSGSLPGGLKLLDQMVYADSGDRDFCELKETRQMYHRTIQKWEEPQTAGSSWLQDPLLETPTLEQLIYYRDQYNEGALFRAQALQQEFEGLFGIDLDQTQANTEEHSHE